MGSSRTRGENIRMTVWINNTPYPNVLYVEEDIATIYNVTPYDIFRLGDRLPRHKLLTHNTAGQKITIYLYNPYEIMRWIEENKNSDDAALFWKQG